MSRRCDARPTLGCVLASSIHVMDEARISKSKVDAAGIALAEAHRHGRTEPRAAADVVDMWREAHADTMAWFERSVSDRMTRAGLDCKVAQRLKRKPQMVRKLLRSRTMRLSQMQDVSGCRVLLQGPDEVVKARARILARASPGYTVRAEADYRAKGRADTKYRAVHLVLLREGRPVEVQLRTRRQHAWAEAVERAAERTGFALKDGYGPEPLIEFFRLASDSFWLLDSGKPLPAPQRKELRRLHSAIKTYLPEVPATKVTTKLDLQAFSTRSNNWLIIYNWRDAEFVNWVDFGTDAEAAARRYGEWERRYPYEEGYEVVLIGADSSKTISETHAHYFGRDPNDIDPHGYLQQIL